MCQAIADMIAEGRQKEKQRADAAEQRADAAEKLADEAVSGLKQAACGLAEAGNPVKQIAKLLRKTEEQVSEWISEGVNV